MIQMLRMRPALTLPVSALLAQVSDASVQPATLALTLLYLEKAFARMPLAEQAAFVPQIMALIPNR